MTVARKYEGKGLRIAFPDRETWYIYPHDEVLQKLLHAKKTSLSTTYSATGGYSFPGLSKEWRQLLREFAITAAPSS